MKRLLSLILSILCVVLAVTVSACGSTPSNFAVHKDNQNIVVKKGVGVSRYNNANSLDKLKNLNIGWYYNWSVNDPFGGSGLVGEFVPMIWGASSVNATNLKKIKDGYDSGKFKYLLTFNEPDHPSQSNMSVDTAIELWPQLEALGIPLSSPCPADYSSGWLDEFMTKAKKFNRRVDFIAIHCYQDFSQSGIENVMKKDFLEVIYQKYQLPIWLTEFGAIDIKYWATQTYTPACNLKMAKEYVENSTKMLEKLGYVERYAWFLDNYNERGDKIPYEGRFSALYNDNDTISETGKLYKAINSNVPVYIDTVILPTGKLNSKYKTTVYGSGGQGNYLFSASGLPNGLVMDKGGNVTGKAQEAGEFSVKVTLTDTKGQATYKNFELIIER